MSNIVRVQLQDFFSPEQAETHYLARGFRHRAAEVWPSVVARRESGSMVNVGHYSYDGDVAAIGPTWTPEYPNSQNQASVWGTGTYLEYLSNMPGIYGSKYMYHSNVTANVSVTYTSTFTIEVNRPWLLKLQLYAHDTAQTTDSFILTHGRMTLTRTGDKVTVALGSFVQEVSLNIPRGGDSYVEILFVPESWGGLRIQVLGSDPVVIKDPTLTKNRRYGQTVIAAAGFSITSTGGQFLWQIGNPLVATSSSAALSNYPNPGVVYSMGLPAATVVVRADAPTGTTVDCAETTVGDGTTDFELTATSDGKYFWFFHAVELFQQGSERSGVTSGPGLPVWDSADHMTDTGTTIIKDIDIQHETGMRRMTLTARIRDIDLGESGLIEVGAANRMCDVQVNGTYLLKGGICTRIAPVNIALIYDNDGNVKGQAISEWGLEICDGWFLLEEEKAYVAPAFDWGRLGALLITMLRTYGWKAHEYANINADAGPIIEAAEVLEDWAEYAEMGITLADYFRNAMKKYGEGLTFYWHNTDGSWTLGNAPKVINHAAVAKCYFSGLAAVPIDGELYIGGKMRYPMRNVVQMPKEYDSIFTAWLVSGDVNAETQQPISKLLRDYEGQMVATSPRFIGRLKFADFITDKGIKTNAAATTRGRAEMDKQTYPGGFVTFKTCYVPNLFEGDAVYLELQKYIVHRIEQCTVANVGEMSLICQEAKP